MMSNKIILVKKLMLFNLTLVFTILLSNIPAFSQKINSNSKEKEAPDYKIINSTESFIELEFYPSYLDDFDFLNSITNVTDYGSPDLKVRSFPVYFPVMQNNRVEIIDTKSEELYNVEIKPVPVYKEGKKKESIVAGYERNDKIYSKNIFFPGDVASINIAGAARNKYFGYLNIFPVLYNPATSTVRKYDYIRVRIVYGGPPVYSSKSLNKEELSLFYNSAINSDISANWSTREFNSQSDLPIGNSVLASGDFYKIEIKETGIYKLDKNYLQNAGINTGNLDPRTIKIYGNGGAQLPFNNSISAPQDPVENRIFVFGENDGQFNDGDYILFYGRSPNEWTYDTLNKTYVHKINHFSKSNYYWITYGGSSGMRMGELNSPNVSGIAPLQKFKDMFFDEPEINNLGSTGNLWVSQRIGINDSYTFNKELNGYVDGSEVNFRFRFGNASAFGETWRLEDLNSNFLKNQFVYQLSGYSHINLVYINDNPLGVKYALLPGRTSINFKASLPSQNANSPNVAGYYDYYEVLYDRYFSAENNVLGFNSPDTNATVEYQINNLSSSDIKIFDVTSQDNVNIINPISYSNGTVRFQANLTGGNPLRYYAVGGNNFRTPVSISSRVPNQNLKGELESGASFIIISPAEFMTAANRLKAQRERSGANYIKTAIVDVEKIYNEFSGGLPDPIAMRNFLKYAYNNWQERPTYVLFFGDGSYDYKNIYNLYSNGVKNWILPIQKNSDFANDVDSYCSDDYLTEINENYAEPQGIAVVDFASGRLCVNSADEANTVVDKIICYEDPANFDKWKNEALYVADDGWTTEQPNGGEGSLHTDQCERLAELHSPAYLKKNKIYIASYPAEFTPQGRRKPGANADIIKGWNEGKLIINYTGHGSTDLWAHEHIFERQVTIPQLNNKCKYPFVTIASCDLARWDDPYNLSAAEELVNSKDKGAIGIIASVRPVYSAPNEIFNNKLYDNIFAYDSAGLHVRMGKAMFNVKQSLFYDNDLKFTLLSDPTIRLAIPQYLTRIDSINSTPGTQLFEMKALQRVNIYGSILRTDSSFWSDYNGKLDLSVLDVDKNITTIEYGYYFNYRLPGGKIYIGKSDIVNGIWTTQFVVPRDISFDPGRGKLIAYFKNTIIRRFRIFK